MILCVFVEAPTITVHHGVAVGLSTPYPNSLGFFICFQNLGRNFSS